MSSHKYDERRPWAPFFQDEELFESAPQTTSFKVFSVDNRTNIFVDLQFSLQFLPPDFWLQFVLPGNPGPFSSRGKKKNACSQQLF